MEVLVRKINRSKWEPPQGFPRGAVPADAVTSDLRTNGNLVSFWKCADDRLEQVFLILSVACDHADKLDVAWLDPAAIAACGVAIQQTPGNTKIGALKDTHYDLGPLDVSRLGDLANALAKSIRSNNTRRLTKATVIRIVARAVDQGLVSLDDLTSKFRAAVETELLGER